MALPKYHMIKFTEWMSLRETEAVTCSKCGEPTSKAELNAYNGQCENCWNKGKSNPQIASLPSGRRVIRKPEPFG